jgi:DNA-binding XRE family transcriptional regulator
MNATQCRMARAGLRWTLDDLAKASGVNRRTILNFENDGPAAFSSVAKVRAVLEKRGVVFIERGVHLGGVVPPKTD